MNKIDELIEHLCPNGVVFKTLEELGLFENIGVDKKTVEGEKKVMLLNFMDVMHNKHLNKHVLSMEVSAPDSKIEKCNIEKYDIFVTPTSETRHEIGFSSVADEKIPNAVYSYHVMRFRLYEKNNITPYFIRYLFESDFLRSQIFKASKGLTRFGLAIKDFGKLKIPYPPLIIQQEILNILDKFTELEAKLEIELEAELEARKKQYEYYRNELLSFDDKEVEWKTMGDVGLIIRGNGLQKKDFTESGIGCIHYGQIHTYYGTFTDRTISYVTEEKAKKLKKASKNNLIIANVSEDVEGACKAVAWLGNNDICVSGDTLIFKHNENPKFLSYYLQTKKFMEYKKKNVIGTKVKRVPTTKFKQFQIPVPSHTEQERIVNILDKFDSLVNDISVSLPAESDARRKQYEYYRNKLLTFNNIADG